MCVGAWYWELVAVELAVRGATVATVEMALTSFEDDVATVREALSTREDVVLVGHSYGGAVISAVGHSARRLVFLTAVMPDAGEDASSAALAFPLPKLGAAIRLIDADTRMTFAPELAGEALYNTSDPELVPSYLARARPGAVACSTTALTVAPAWRKLPSTYIICLQDQALTPDLQRFFADRAGSHVLTLDSDHSPMLHMPGAVADAILSEPETGAR
jgi:pimeloyl-ACP methyl ester carboxylesterase